MARPSRRCAPRGTTPLRAAAGVREKARRTTRPRPRCRTGRSRKRTRPGRAPPGDPPEQKGDDRDRAEDIARCGAAPSEAIGQPGPGETSDQRSRAEQRDHRANPPRVERERLFQIQRDEGGEQLVGVEIDARQQDAAKRQPAPPWRDHRSPSFGRCVRRARCRTPGMMPIVGHEDEGERCHDQRNRADPHQHMPVRIAQRAAERAEQDVRQRIHRRIERDQAAAHRRRKR